MKNRCIYLNLAEKKPSREPLIFGWIGLNTSLWENTSGTGKWVRTFAIYLEHFGMFFGHFVEYFFLVILDIYISVHRPPNINPLIREI